jgi:ABC-type nitrate/sulfonate/bicarbonate transport system substrate-binding protein
MALDELRQQGYTIEATQFARFDLVTAALIKGDLDIAGASNQTAWAAIAKGAPIRAIVSWVGNQFRLVTKAEIKSCADLKGKSIAIGSTASIHALMLEQYLKRNCPGIETQVVVVPSNSSRFSALVSGEIIAAVLETDYALQLDRQSPGRFHTFSHFAQEFPQVELGGYYVHDNFVKHPEIIKDYVRAMIRARRRIQDKQVLRDAVNKYLPDDAGAFAAVDTYLAENVWDVNGGLTPERIQFTLDFMTKANMLPAGLRADQIADLSYLNAVLDEIGRK